MRTRTEQKERRMSGPLMAFVTYIYNVAGLTRPAVFDGTCRIILMHTEAHFDELVAVWMLRRYGSKKFPGVVDAKIVSFPRRILPTGGDELKAFGILCVGIGGGEFDEHPTGPGSERKKDWTAATLVYEAVADKGDKILEAVAAEAARVDLRGARNEWHFASILKAAYKTFTAKGNEAKVWKLAFSVLDAMASKSDDFFKEAPRQPSRTRAMPGVLPAFLKYVYQASGLPLPAQFDATGKQVNVILMPRKPTFDDIAALNILQGQAGGDKEYVGAERAKVISYPTESIPLPGDELRKYGILCIGTGAGRFDPWGAGRGSDECTATFEVLDAMQCRGDNFFRLIAEESMETRRTLRWHLAHVTKALFATYSFADALSHANWLVETAIMKQENFFTEGADAFETADKIRIQDGLGQERTIVVGVTKVHAFGAYARSQFGAKADVVIQKQPQGAGGRAGQVMVFVTKHRVRGEKLDVRKLARAIRIGEQQAGGKRIIVDDEMMMQEGTVEGAECWYYHPGLKAVMNGSDSAPAAPPTQMSLPRIVEIVRGWLGAEFESSRRQHCENGVCYSGPTNPCPLKVFEFEHCRAVRQGRWSSRLRQIGGAVEVAST